MVYSNYQFSKQPSAQYGSNMSFRGAPAFKSNYNQQDTTSFSGALTESEANALTDCYVSSPNESLLAAIWGGVSFALMNSARLVVHPKNTFKAFKHVDPMFKDVLKDGSELNKLWKDPKTNEAMRDAYCEMHRAFARGEKKAGWFRRQYSKDNIDQLKGIMEKALKEAKGEPPEKAREIITTATETLKSAYISDGRLGFLGRLGSGSSKAKTFAEGIADTATIKKQTSEALKFSATSFKQALKKHASFKSVIVWAGFELLIGFSNIIKSFQKDKENEENGVKTNYGKKQLGQTIIKGLGAGVGWGVGEAFGNWAFAKWGAKLGSKIHPALGTVTGGVIGLVGASIGMMFTGRLTKKMVGEDIGEKIKAQELTQTPEGQAQLLQGVYEKVQKGEASPEATAALQKAILQIHG